MQFDSNGELKEDGSIKWEKVPETTWERQQRLIDLRCLHGLDENGRE